MEDTGSALPQRSDGMQEEGGDLNGFFLDNRSFLKTVAEYKGEEDDKKVKKIKRRHGSARSARPCATHPCGR